MLPLHTRQALYSRCTPVIFDSCYYPSNSSSKKNMKFLHFIANAFINTMGITQPSPQAANRAAWFIVIMLTVVLAAVATIAFVAIHWAAHP